MSIEVLVDAKSILQSGGWTKGSFARDKHGDPVPVFDDKADSFDLSGAVIYAAGGINIFSESALRALSECLVEPMPDWQDNASFSEVLACVDETVATLRSRL